MRTFAITMYFNESEWVYKHLKYIHPLVDELLIFEGTVSPWDDQYAHSTDNTEEEIEKFILDNCGCGVFYEDLLKTDKIVYWSPKKKNEEIKTREHYEGWAKNELLKRSSIEDGDLLVMVDADEFYKPEALENIFRMFDEDENLLHIPVEEYQFAYNTSLWFKASHTGRFMRYKEGCRYSTSQHLIYPDGTDASKLNLRNFLPREQSQFYHLCWVKHPERIREKVLTFKRPSFTAWYNNVYLNYPEMGEEVYNINRLIPPYYGRGFCEGQHEPLQEFQGTLPEVIQDVQDDWLEYIQENKEKLKI